MPQPANWPHDSSHELGLGSLNGTQPINQPDGDHDAQGRPTPRAHASAADTAPSSATEISYPAEGKIRFVYEGNDITPNQAATDARNWAAREFFNKFPQGKNRTDVMKNIIILGVHVMPGKIIVTVGLPDQRKFKNNNQQFPSSRQYDSQV